MQDLSNLLPDGSDSLVPTSQVGTNQPHANRAMTAPGGVSGSDSSIWLDNRVTQPAPDVDEISYDPKGTTHVLNDAGGHQIPDENAGRPTLYTQGDGHGWKKPRS